MERFLLDISQLGEVAVNPRDGAAGVLFKHLLETRTESTVIKGCQ
jgi:hypothetical protein